MTMTAAVMAKDGAERNCSASSTQAEHMRLSLLAADRRDNGSATLCRGDAKCLHDARQRADVKNPVSGDTQAAGNLSD